MRRKQWWRSDAAASLLSQIDELTKDANTTLHQSPGLRSAQQARRQRKNTKRPKLEACARHLTEASTNSAPSSPTYGMPPATATLSSGISPTCRATHRYPPNKDTRFDRAFYAMAGVHFGHKKTVQH